LALDCRVQSTREPVVERVQERLDEQGAVLTDQILNSPTTRPGTLPREAYTAPSAKRTVNANPGHRTAA
jgi:hypothetical protein